MSAYGDTIKYIKAINTEYFHAVIFYGLQITLGNLGMYSWVI